jgi:DNA polymerase I-like protein with 3'-5' exonuclease and polymerase domains
VPDPGYVFFYNDLERAESLVVAHITGDPLMLKHHAPGVNAHKELGSLLFGMPVSDIDKEGDVYYLAKRTRHAGNYMLGWKKFQDIVNKDAAVTGVALDAAYAKKLIGGYRDLHTGLTRWWNHTRAELLKSGTLHNLFGRPREFFEYLDSILPEAVAYVPQSTVGDLLNYGFLRCYHDPVLKALGVRYLMQVHDAIGGQVPEEHLAAAMTRMRQLMRIPLLNPRGEEFIVPIEINIGPSWGEVAPWDEDIKVAA